MFAYVTQVQNLLILAFCGGDTCWLSNQRGGVTQQVFKGTRIKQQDSEKARSEYSAPNSWMAPMHVARDCCDVRARPAGRSNPPAINELSGRILRLIDSPARQMLAPVGTITATLGRVLHASRASPLPTRRPVLQSPAETRRRGVMHGVGKATPNTVQAHEAPSPVEASVGCVNTLGLSGG